MAFLLVREKLDDEGTCFGLVPEDGGAASIPSAQMHDGPAPQGGCYLRCYNGKVSDDRGTVGRGSPVPSCFKLHPGATLKIVLDPLARTATFFVGEG